MATDTERLDWFEHQDGGALVSDDAGHWVVVFTGIQNVPMNPPEDIQTTFWIKKDEWCKTVREAIDKAMANEEVVTCSEHGCDLEELPTGDIICPECEAD